MCRHLAWLGAPRSLGGLLLEPEHGLLRQLLGVVGSRAPLKNNHVVGANDVEIANASARLEFDVSLKTLGEVGNPDNLCRSLTQVAQLLIDRGKLDDLWRRETSHDFFVV